jgi:hypothetical protein
MNSEIIQSVDYYDNYDDFQHVNFIFSQNFSEIIQSVDYYDNYDDFQHVNFIFFTKFHFTILRIIFLRTLFTILRIIYLKVRYSKSSTGLYGKGYMGQVLKL